jgi:hypothetical protein
MHRAELQPDRHRPVRRHRVPPNDVITMAANENYRDPAKPAFAT